MNYSLSLCFAIAFLSFTISAPPIFLDPDVAWHIAAGNYIVESGSIPFYDPWSYIGSEQQWYNLSWLWDVGVALLNKAVGFYGLSIALSLMLSCICCYCYCSLLNRRYSLSHDAIMISTTFHSLLFIEIGCLRPQLATSFCIAVTCNKLYDFYYKNTKASLYTIPALTLLLANMHGGFLLIFVVIGLYFLISVYEKNYSTSKYLVYLGLICFVTTFINPIGYKIYAGTLRTLHSVAIVYISEWRPFFFGQSYPFSMMLMMLLLSGCALTHHYNHIKVKIGDWLTGLFFFINSIFAVRNFGNLATTGLPFVAGIIDRVLPKPKFASVLSAPQKIWLGCVLMISAIAINVFFIITKHDRKIGLKDIPVTLIEYAAHHYPNEKFFNNYNIGGYVVLFGNGKIKHFIDGRAGTAFTEARLQSCIDILDRKISFLAVAEASGADAVIIDDRLLAAQHDSEMKNWEIQYQHNHYNILRRKEVRIAPDA